MKVCLKKKGKEEKKNTQAISLEVSFNVHNSELCSGRFHSLHNKQHCYRQRVFL